MTTETWTFQAEVSHVSAARHAVGAYAEANGVPESAVACLKQALTEAVTNAVLHGYRSAETGSVTVILVIEPSTLALRVLDDGEGMNRPPEEPGLGLGMLLMREMSDRMTIGTAATGRGTEVCLGFDYVAVEAEQDAAASGDVAAAP